jgi:hypothetical protein
MDVLDQIDAYIASQPEPKRADLLALHEHILQLIPGCRLRFLDGTNDDGKVVTNPDIGYGSYVATLAGGKTRDFYQVGLSPNTSGISLYIMGIKDRKFLPQTYGDTIGKATVTGYCIKFRKLADIDVKVLDAAIRSGLEATA